MANAGASSQVRPAPPRMSRHAGMVSGAWAIALFALLPIVAVIVLAASDSGDVWPHLIANVIPRATATTIALLTMVAVLTASMGIVTASLIVRCDFPGRRFLAWALVLPIAIPPYVASYAFAEFFLFSGPIQTALRAVTGWQSARDYWFPDIRTTAGAAFVMSMVLYPYVYLSTRVVLLMQGRVLGDAARTLGAGAMRSYWRVLLPVTRPAVAAGVALALMETLNDIGAVEYLGVRTLTLSVYTTWLSRGSLAGAAQIALILLGIVALLLIAERWARRGQRYHAARASQMQSKSQRARLSGWYAAAAFTACAGPVLIGFGIPAYVLGGYALRRVDQFTAPALHSAFFSSIGIGAATSIVTVVLALLLLQAIRMSRLRSTAAAARISTLGYALPGTVLGIGLLFIVGSADNAIATAVKSFGFGSPGLIISGSGAAIVIACAIRFMALAENNIQAGIDKLPRHLEDAARCLGMSAASAQRAVLLPLLKPAIATAGVLVFVDTVKELSATILLRPFGLSTLSTTVYENASRGAIEDGSAAALLIIIISAVPVLMLSRMLIRDEIA